MSSSPVPFPEATAWTRAGELLWRSALTPDWCQGRSSFGGYLTAGASRALGALVEERLTLRSMLTFFVGPVFVGDFEAEARVVSSGANVTTLEMELRQEGATRTKFIATYAAPRASNVVVQPDPREEHPGPEHFEEIPYFPGIMPECTQHFRFRWTDGGFPFSGSDVAHHGGWVRLPETNGALTLPTVLALLDAFPLPMMQMYTMPRPGASLTWNAHLVDLADADPTDWWWIRAETLHAGEGYGSFITYLYRRDGRLAAWADQAVALYDVPSGKSAS